MQKFLLACLVLLFPNLALSQDFSSVVEASVKTGWRTASGQHVAALHLELAPGWKTYWRAPGDAGIPPSFDWSGSQNVKDVKVVWPTPVVFWQSGLRSIGYAKQVTFPIQVTPLNPSAPIALKATVDLGICEEVCVPYRMSFDATLAPGKTRPDPKIAAAMADRPFSGAEAGVTRVTCDIAVINDGMSLTVAIDMPKGTGKEVAVVETKDPEVWVAEPKTKWQGSTFVAQTKMLHIDGGGFAVDRSGIRITLLGGRMPVDIQGCTAG